MKGDSDWAFKPENAEAVRAVFLIPAEQTDSLWQLNIAWKDFREGKGNDFSFEFLDGFIKISLVSHERFCSLCIIPPNFSGTVSSSGSSLILCLGLILFHTNKGWQEMNGSVTIMTLAETGSSQVYSNF